MTRLHVLATGLVQGVGFRWFVRETARRAPASRQSGISQTTAKRFRSRSASGDSGHPARAGRNVISPFLERGAEFTESAAE